MDAVYYVEENRSRLLYILAKLHLRNVKNVEDRIAAVSELILRQGRDIDPVNLEVARIMLRELDELAGKNAKSIVAQRKAIRCLKLACMLALVFGYLVLRIKLAQRYAY